MNNENINEESLKKLILDRKINNRLLSLIEIIDNMILNQFFISYVDFNNEILNRDGEPFVFSIDDKKYINMTSINKTIDFYTAYQNNENILPNTIQNEFIRHPFDVSGTDKFLRIFLTIENQSNNEFYKNYFSRNLKNKLLLYFKDINDFITKLFTIKQLRNYIEHNGDLENRKDIIKFYEKSNPKKTNDQKYSKIAQTKFSILQSLQSIFIFLPDIELSELYQLMTATIKKNNTDNTTEILENNLQKIFKAIKENNTSNMKIIMKQLSEKDKNYLYNIKDKWKNKLVQKNLKLFEFIKVYNVMGYFTISKIKHILKIIIKNNTKLNKKLFDNITLEEIYKIFKFFNGLNEIIRIDFINIYEQLNSYITNSNKFKKLKDDKSNTKITNEKDKIDKKLKRLKIKSKLTEMIRNNIAHSNLFFHIDTKYTNNEDINNDFNNYSKIFNLYIREIIKFYNIKYNSKIFSLCKKNITTKNLSFKQCKAQFIKRISAFLLKKDYLFLLVPQISKNKKGEESIIYEMQKLSISNDNKDVKQAFQDIIKTKINDILNKENDGKLKIYRKKIQIGTNNKIQGISVIKYQLYYSLKKVLIEELNNIKQHDKQFLGINI